VSRGTEDERKRRKKVGDGRDDERVPAPGLQINLHSEKRDVSPD
jgi:hypothetical protein